MKNKSFKLFGSAAFIGLTILGAGCAKIDKFGNINSDPNGVTTPVPAALLTNVEQQLGGIVNGVRTICYCQYVAENQYTDVSLYA
jgi:hypothetical protein